MLLREEIFDPEFSWIADEDLRLKIVEEYKRYNLMLPNSFLHLQTLARDMMLIEQGLDQH